MPALFERMHSRLFVFTVVLVQISLASVTLGLDCPKSIPPLDVDIDPRLPDFLRDYAQFHKESLQSDSAQYIIYTCTDVNACGDFGNRLAGIADALYLAVVTRRVLLIHHTPFPLEDSLRPRAIDWLSRASCLYDPEHTPVIPTVIQRPGPAGMGQPGKAEPAPGDPVPAPLDDLVNLNAGGPLVDTVVKHFQGEKVLAFPGVTGDNIGVWDEIMATPEAQKVLSASARDHPTDYSSNIDNPTGGTSNSNNGDGAGSAGVDTFAVEPPMGPQIFAWAWAFLFQPSPSLTQSLSQLRKRLQLPEEGSPWISVLASGHSGSADGGGEEAMADGDAVGECGMRMVSALVRKYNLQGPDGLTPQFPGSIPVYVSVDQPGLSKDIVHHLILHQFQPATVHSLADLTDEDIMGAMALLHKAGGAMSLNDRTRVVGALAHFLLGASATCLLLPSQGDTAQVAATWLFSGMGVGERCVVVMPECSDEAVEGAIEAAHISMAPLGDELAGVVADVPAATAAALPGATLAVAQVAQTGVATGDAVAKSAQSMDRAVGGADKAATAAVMVDATVSPKENPLPDMFGEPHTDPDVGPHVIDPYEEPHTDPNAATHADPYGQPHADPNAATHAVDPYGQPHTDPNAATYADPYGQPHADPNAATHADPYGQPHADPNAATHADPYGQPHADPNAATHAVDPYGQPHADPNAATHADPYGEPHTDPNAATHADPYGQPHADPNAATHADPYGQPHADPNAATHADPYGQPHADPNAATHADPYGEPHTDLNAATHADPYGQPHADPNAATHADPYGEPHTDLNAATHADPYGQPDADPYAATHAVDPYGQPHADPNAATHADPYGEPHTDPNAATHADPYGQPHADPNAATHADPYGQPHADPNAATHADPYGQPHADPNAATHADPYGEPHTDLNAATHADPYGQPHADPNAATHADPYGEPHTDLNAATHADPYGQPDADPYAATHAVDPYGQPHADPNAATHADPYGQPHADPNAATHAVDPYGQPHADPNAATHADPYGQPHADPNAATHADPYGQPHADPDAATHAVDPYGQPHAGLIGGTLVDPYGEPHMDPETHLDAFSGPLNGLLGRPEGWDPYNGAHDDPYGGQQANPDADHAMQPGVFDKPAGALVGGGGDTVPAAAMPQTTQAAARTQVLPPAMVLGSHAGAGKPAPVSVHGGAGQAAVGLPQGGAVGGTRRAPVPVEQKVEEEPTVVWKTRAVQPVAKPVAQPVAKPVAQPVAKPVAQPVAKPVAQPAPHPASQPASGAFGTWDRFWGAPVASSVANGGKGPAQGGIPGQTKSSAAGAGGGGLRGGNGGAGVHAAVDLPAYGAYDAYDGASVPAYGVDPNLLSYGPFDLASTPAGGAYDDGFKAYGDPYNDGMLADGGSNHPGQTSGTPSSAKLVPTQSTPQQPARAHVRPPGRPDKGLVAISGSEFPDTIDSGAGGGGMGLPGSTTQGHGAGGMRQGAGPGGVTQGPGPGGMRQGMPGRRRGRLRGRLRGGPGGGQGGVGGGTHMDNGDYGPAPYDNLYSLPGDHKYFEGGPQPMGGFGGPQQPQRGFGGGVEFGGPQQKGSRSARQQIQHKVDAADMAGVPGGGLTGPRLRPDRPRRRHQPLLPPAYKRHPGGADRDSQFTIGNSLGGGNGGMMPASTHVPNPALIAARWRKSPEYKKIMARLQKESKHQGKHHGL
eukprot:jgi/Mesvir1/15718/Mv03297-RA.1